MDVYSVCCQYSLSMACLHLLTGIPLLSSKPFPALQPIASVHQKHQEQQSYLVLCLMAFPAKNSGELLKHTM